MLLTPGQTPDRRTLLRDALQAVEEMQRKLAQQEYAAHEPIAVVGIGCRFPGGVDSPASFWALLQAGRDAIGPIPPDRTELAEFARNAPSVATWRGGFLDQPIDRFDPEFFGIAPREAPSMDPQQRLLLEVAWEALEHAAIPPTTLAGSRTGVFVGITNHDYAFLAAGVDPEQLDIYSATGTSLNIAAGRLAYVLGLNGPALAVDTACSSALVAVHLAIQSLRRGESDLALAGGVHLMIAPEPFVCFTRWGMAAADGRCKTFDAAADGFVRAEGCGVVVLKRLTDAQRDGDTILAVLRGSAINQDGASGGLTVPNGLAQRDVIRAALADARVAPRDITYVEAHGTGTALGDPIEIEALGVVLSEERGADRPLVVGSVKTNLGHLEAAAGIAGLIKTILVLQHGEIPPHLHLKQRNPRIPWPSFPIEVPATPMPWPLGPRLAGVSAFGFSGTNAHVIVEAAPAPLVRPVAAAQGGITAVVPISATSEAALRETAKRYHHYLNEHPEATVAAVAHEAATGRVHFRHRAALVAESTDALAAGLDALANGQFSGGMAAAAHMPRVWSGVTRGDPPKVAFVFSGQGAQYAGMGRALYASEPVFRRAMDECARLLHPHLDRPLLDLLFGAPPTTADSRELIKDTISAQPALVALEWALTELWRSWGVTPWVVAGHSVGEITAAIVAGVLSLADGLRLAAVRGQLMGALPPGGRMAAVFAEESRIRHILAPYAGTIALAAVNAPRHVVISGEDACVGEILARLSEEGITWRDLHVSHAFHSPILDPMLSALEAEVATLSLHAPRLRIVSGLSGDIAGTEIATPAYWRRQAREPVRFAEATHTLHTLGCSVVLEIGPHPVLLPAVAETLAAAEPATTLPLVASLRRGRADGDQIAEAVAVLYTAGASLNWQALVPTQPMRAFLPTYPFQRRRFWLDLPASQRGSSAGRRERGTGAPDGTAHPLLGQRLRSPLIADTVFASWLSAASPSYLTDHRVYGDAIFPGAGYVEMMLATAASSLPTPLRIEGLEFTRALALPEGDAGAVAVHIQTIVQADTDGAPRVRIYSLPSDADEAGEWTLHAQGLVRFDCSLTAGEPVEPAALRLECPQPVDVEAYYRSLKDAGLAYGPAFRGIRELYRGEGVALGRVHLDPSVGSGRAYAAHPALLDACFQIFGAALSESLDGPVPYLPIGIETVRLYAPLDSEVWCQATVQSDGKNSTLLSGTLRLFDGGGRLVAELTGLRLKAIDADMLRHATGESGHWLHQVSWQPLPFEGSPVSRQPEPAGTWLILADTGGVGQTLACRLRERGEHVITVHRGSGFSTPAPDTYAIDAAQSEQYHHLIAAVADVPNWRGIVYLWSLDTHTDDEPDGATLQAAHEAVITGALGIARALVLLERAKLPRLWLITCGAQSVTSPAEPLALGQAPLWGLGRTIAAEHPALRCSCADLDPAASADTIDALADQLLAEDREDQLAWRGGTRYVARLLQGGTARQTTTTTQGGPFQLAIEQRGRLDGITLRPCQRRQPGAGEVEIAVRATGLNFRDVLNVLGMYPGDLGPPGLECSGLITAVGEGVQEFRVGDAVFGIAPESFASHVITLAELVAPKPERVSFAEAAALPVAYLTALWGLHDLARIQAGDRVLIHSAAGGVGQAAVRLALRAGAEVFGTAGSPAKRAYLTAQGVHHVMDSRSLTFADETMALTGGRGVDVVLNALTDEFIPRSIDTLARGGRFVEIGKRGIWTAEQVTQHRPDVAYFPFDLADVQQRQPGWIAATLRWLAAECAAGTLTPLPVRSFPIEEVTNAFRYLAQARHIGKVVVVHREPALGVDERIRSDATYLITGGLGSLGLCTAQWLAERGARHLALVGRSAPTAAARETLRAIEALGARVTVLHADVGCARDVERVITEITRTMPPLRGIIHAAGILDDAILAQQDHERVRRVMAPKADGAWNLHRATRHLDLDAFVLYSSASAVLGSPGQANYAAANAFLDALAHHRHAAGLAALSVNWGPWAGAGMAAAAGERGQRRWREQGIEMIDPVTGLQALARLLRASAVQALVLPVRWRTWRRDQAGGTPPLLSTILGQRTAETAAPSLTRAAVLDAPPGEREGLVATYLANQIGGILRISAAQIGGEQPLIELGIDSLMAVELKNRIELDLGVVVPVATILDGASVSTLGSEILAQVEDRCGVTGRQVQDTTGGAGAVARPDDPERARALLATVDQLSDAEVAQLLHELLPQEAGPT